MTNERARSVSNDGECSPSGDENGRARSPSAPLKRKLSYKEQRELEALPERIAALEKEIAEIESALGDPSLYVKEPAKAAAYAERLAPAKEELDAAETRWLELSDV